jgi:hypothetical protein
MEISIPIIIKLYYGRMASKENIWPWVAGVILALLLGFIVGRNSRKSVENFQNGNCSICQRPSPCGCKPECNRCNKPRPCDCPDKKGREPVKFCPPCEQPDMSKWIQKSSVPPCPPVPDMSRYMLKTECPPQPDMSKYVLKSSVPKCPPCISTCSKPCKIGECPPCPRPRCPTVQCPEPKACPACPAAVCEPCPEPAIQCNAKYEPKTAVRPMLASTSVFGF